MVGSIHRDGHAPRPNTTTGGSQWLAPFVVWAQFHKTRPAITRRPTKWSSTFVRWRGGGCSYGQSTQFVKKLPMPPCTAVIDTSESAYRKIITHGVGINNVRASNLGRNEGQLNLQDVVRGYVSALRILSHSRLLSIEVKLVRHEADANALGRGAAGIGEGGMARNRSRANHHCLRTRGDNLRRDNLNDFFGKEVLLAFSFPR